MKYQFQLLLLGLVLLVVIIISLSSACPVPYSKNNIFTKEFPYTEGLEDKKSKDNKEGIFTKTEGFQGLQSSPYNDEKPIDHFSQLSSGKECEYSPYSNSKGYLCLDEKAKQMLSTRGGNQTGQGSQFGSP